MHPQFEQLTPHWFERAFVYTGSIGDFRYRYAMDKENNQLHVAIYTVYCYEVANDVEHRDFDWTDEGVEELKQWLQASYEAFLAK